MCQSQYSKLILHSITICFSPLTVCNRELHEAQPPPLPPDLDHFDGQTRRMIIMTGSLNTSSWPQVI